MVVSEIWWVKCWLIGVCLRQGWTLSHPHRWSACEGQIVWFLESSFCVCRASHLSLTFHPCPFSSRASLANCRLNLALVYFEKAVDNVIANKGDNTSDLVSLYQEIAQIEQLRRNHEQAIQYLHQVGGLAEVQARRLCLAAGLVLRREEQEMGSIFLQIHTRDLPQALGREHRLAAGLSAVWPDLTQHFPSWLPSPLSVPGRGSWGKKPKGQLSSRL